MSTRILPFDTHQWLSRMTLAMAIGSAVAVSTLAQDAGAQPLTRTSWQLVKISYSDDKIHKPDDPAKYTLSFRDDKSVAARIDCNRGRGTWKSAEPGKLEFGLMATTRAMCPPGSLHDFVVRDLPDFRSYITKDKHLYLSLKADGGIYAFEPMSTKRNGEAEKVK
jgi:para-nitrobenzyl esterase